jgi:hypothetical protein
MAAGATLMLQLYERITKKTRFRLLFQRNIFYFAVVKGLFNSGIENLNVSHRVSGAL